MQAGTANGKESSDRRQFNVLIDRDLHTQLRMQAIARGRSLRDFSEDVIRCGMTQIVGSDGQDIGPSPDPEPVETGE